MVVVLAIAVLGCPVAGLAQLAVRGIIRAENDVEVQSDLAGVVQQILVEEGDRVREGDVLIELDNERERINLELARAGVVRANALINETDVLLENARRELDRLMIAGDSVPRKEREDVEDQIRRLEAGLGAQEADRERAAEEVRLREYELRETRILAPFDGTVTEIHVTRGESLRPLDMPVMTLVGLDDLFLEVLLPTHYLSHVRRDQAVPIQAEAEWMGDRGRVEGRIAYINPTVDASSRTFRVKVAIPNANGSFRPGMLAEARFPD